MQEIFFWDMDHTIINNDCDVSWKDFLISSGLAPESDRDLAEKFYQDYLDRCLDSDEFNAFQLREIVGKSELELRDLCQKHFEQIVKDKIYPQAQAMIAQQQAEGKLLCLITSTNTYIAEPLAKHLNIPHLRASVLELSNARFTGKITGELCLGLGKVRLMEKFFQSYGGSLEHAHYYGDSSADIVIMEQIGHQHCINPTGELLEAAQKNNWDILSFH